MDTQDMVGTAGRSSTIEAAGVPERRRHPRTQLQMTLRCVRLDPDGGDVVDSLSLYDISRNGIGAYCDRPFYPGQRLVLCLPLTGGNGRRNIYATVTRCRPTEDGYRVGMVFDRVSLGNWSAAQDMSAAA